MFLKAKYNVFYKIRTYLNLQSKLLKIPQNNYFMGVREACLFTKVTIIFMMKKMAAINIILLILVSVVLGAFGQISMKKGLKNKPIQINELVSLKFFSTVFEPNVFLGVVLYIVATLIWLVVLSNAEVSQVYPLIALGYIVTAVFARIYLGENISFLRWLGIILIVAGAVLVVRS